MKNNETHTYFAFLFAILSGGCVPLQQAPLVYSSKLIVGIDVSANIAESQGGSINIGVKTVDSAYVPVGVSKQIDVNSNRSDKTVEIKLIEARYGEGVSKDSSDEATSAERNRKIDAYFNSKLSAESAASAYSNAEINLSNVSTLISQLETLKVSIINADKSPDNPAPTTSGVALTPSRTQLMKQKADELAKFSADKNLSLSALTSLDGSTFNTTKVLSEIDNVLFKNRESKATLEAQVLELKTQSQAKADQAKQAKDEAVRVAGLAQTSKTDAFSVYGRFDSNGGATTNAGAGAQLLTGKVFSTGLASQNLTEAVKIEARFRCLRDGIEIAKGLDDPARKAFLGDLAKLCNSKFEK